MNNRRAAFIVNTLKLLTTSKEKYEKVPPSIRQEIARNNVIATMKKLHNKKAKAFTF